MAHHQVGDLMFLEMPPKIFDRIEFGRISRQGFDDQPLVGAGEEISDQSTAVDHGAIPDDQQAAGQVAQERPEKLDDLRPFDRTRVNLEIEIPKGNACNEGETFPTEGLLDDRRLSAWCPSTNPMRAGAQAAFVDENNGPALAAGFFLSLGQVECFQ
jgi:hypothetical protein